MEKHTIKLPGIEGEWIEVDHSTADKANELIMLRHIKDGRLRGERYYIPSHKDWYQLSPGPELDKIVKDTLFANRQWTGVWSRRNGPDQAWPLFSTDIGDAMSFVVPEMLSQGWSFQLWAAYECKVVFTESSSEADGYTAHGSFGEIPYRICQAALSAKEHD